MTGVLGLNALFLFAGAGLMFGVRGWKSWPAFAGEIGLVYIVGVAGTGVVVTLSLIAGIPFSAASIVVIGLAIAAIGIAVGVRRSSARPVRPRLTFRRPQTTADVLTLVAAAVTAVLALDMAIANRHARLVAFDAWNFWIPKAKVIYFFGGIDHEIFRQLAHPSYPLFVPALDAMVFRAGHSTDPALLGTQYGLLLIGVLGALASLLVPLAGRALTWTFLALFLVLPEVANRWFAFMADWTLASFFAVAAVVLGRWLRTREGWLLPIGTVMIAATLVAKREGQVFVAILFIALGTATIAERRRVWPKLVLVAAAAFVVSQLPWRIWWMSHHLPSDLTEGGIASPGSFGRLLTSAQIVLQLLFSYNLWLLALPIALVTAAAALLVSRENRRLVALYGVTLILLYGAFIWAIWATPTIPLDIHDRAYDPVPRETASVALLSVAFAAVFTNAALARRPFAALSLDPLTASRLLASRARARLVAARPSRVVGGLVVLQWVLVLGIAVSVRHAGWIYYQGGDQLWYYTTGWSLVHGHYPQPGVGYLWSILLAPIAAVTGSNIANAYPAIVVVQFVFLLPIALVATYGIGRQIGGRLLGYWTAALWILVPLIGIEYTNAGYHQRYTEVLLPQAFGLTAMADFPATVATAVAGYFCIRTLSTRSGWSLEAISAGLAAGAAFAIKPSAALFLAGPALAFAVTRRWRDAAGFVVGVAPAAVALAFVKWRGFGYLPLFHTAAGVRLAADHVLPLGSSGFGHYLHFNWAVFTQQLDQLREHFWSARLVEWLVVAGLIAVMLRSRRYGLLILGWFAATVLIKTGSGRGGMEGGNLLRLLMPAYPAFIVMLASLPFLLPRLPRRIPPAPPAAPVVRRRIRLTLVAAGVLLTGVIPIAAYAAAKPIQGPNPEVAILEQPPIPLHADLHLRATATPKALQLSWTPQRPAGGPVFYHVYRAPANAPWVVCNGQIGSSADYCALQLTDLGTTKSAAFVVHAPPKGAWRYFVGVTANWLDDVTQGDVYELGEPVAVTVH